MLQVHFTEVLRHPKNFFPVKRYRHLDHLSLQLDLQIPRLYNLFPAKPESLKKTRNGYEKYKIK